MALALMKMFPGGFFVFAALLFSQEEGRPGDQSALKAHGEPICHRRLALAARGSSVHMICETWALHLVLPI